MLCISTGIKYFMATSGKQNCDSVCASFGLQCAGTGQSFPNSSALSIFESLGITCDTNNYTDYYFYKDQPNYISASPPSKDLQWAGRCTGFKAIPSTIDFYTRPTMTASVDSAHVKTLQVGVSFCYYFIIKSLFFSSWLSPCFSSPPHLPLIPFSQF